MTVKHPIYVVVYIHYDYYTFQENLFGSTSHQECLDFIDKRYGDTPYYEDNRHYPIIAKTLKDNETVHYFIERL